MKLKWYELLLAALTLAFACFTAGFFVGRDDRAEITVTTQYSTPSLPPSAQPEAEPSPAASSDGKVDINTADEKTLAALPGVGDVLAERIVKYRTEHGPFGTIYDITAVAGIGDGKLESMKEHITAGEAGG